MVACEHGHQPAAWSDKNAIHRFLRHSTIEDVVSDRVVVEEIASARVGVHVGVAVGDGHPSRDGRFLADALFKGP